MYDRFWEKGTFCPLPPPAREKTDLNRVNAQQKKCKTKNGSLKNSRALTRYSCVDFPSRITPR